MTTAQRHPILHYLRKLLGKAGPDSVTDDELLQRFVTGRDQAAFELLVWRHAAMVSAVCHGVLHDIHDAEDAFQATFLALVRKAGSISKGASLGGWLYQVAYRVALKAQSLNAGRSVHEPIGPDLPASRARCEPGDEVALRELGPVLHEEISRLPAKYRTPTVLCYLEGKTHEEAARQLGWPEGTVSGRLARARDMLRQRLTRRGLAVSAAALAAFPHGQAAAAASSTLIQATTKAALLAATGKIMAAGGISARVVTLTEGVVRAMFITKVKIGLTVLLAFSILGTAAVVCTSGTAGADQVVPAKEEDRPDAKKAQHGPLEKARTVEQIDRQELEILTKELIQVRSDLRKARVELALGKAKARAKDRPAIPESTFDAITEKDPEMRKQRRRVEDLSDQIAKTRKVLARDDGRIIAKLQEQLKSVQTSLKERRDMLRADLVQKLRDRDDLKTRVTTLQERIAVLTDLEKSLMEDINRLAEKVQRSGPSVEERLRRLEKEVRRLKAAVKEFQKGM